MIGLMGIGLLLLLMLFLDFPVAYAMFLSGFIGLCFVIPIDSALTVVFREIWEGVFFLWTHGDSFILTYGKCGFLQWDKREIVRIG